MNLFLLFAVPLAAVALHRLRFPARAPFEKAGPWITGFIWSVLPLVAVTPFGSWRAFDGSLWATGLGLTFTDALLVPGGLVAAWLVFRDRQDEWELALWLALAFTMAGLRDAVSVSRTSDLNEYFLVPLQRLTVLLWLPLLVVRAWAAAGWLRGPWWAAAGLLVLTAPLYQVLSFAGWGWLVWVLEALTLAGGVWFFTAAARPSRP